VAGDEAHNSGLAGRYATAVFELAQDEQATDTVARDFATLKALIAENPDLARLVRAPVFSREQQKRGMEGILQHIGAAPLTTRFVLTLATKRRLSVLTDIIRVFEEMVARQRGEVEADVASAVALTDSEIAELKRVLKAKLGRDARLTTRVDPSLLGGLVVKVGSRMIDSSLRTKLEGLAVAMKGH
jgi:F-type H+-transporting ATPase subunit delta